MSEIYRCQPFALIVENQTNESVSDVSVFGAHNLIRLMNDEGSFKKDGIYVHSFTSQLSYNEMLWNSVERNIGTISKIVAESYHFANEDYGFFLTIKSKDHTGNSCERRVVEKDYEQEKLQNSIRQFDCIFELNGSTSIVLNRIPPECRIRLWFYPDGVNKSRASDF